MVVNCRLYRENLSAKQTQEDPAAVFQDNVSIVPRQCIYCLNYTKSGPVCTRLYRALCEKTGAEQWVGFQFKRAMAITRKGVGGSE